MSRIQTFNFQGFDEKSDFLQPLLFYILHRTTESITDEANLDIPKNFILDEAFVFFKHRSIVDYLNKGLLTWSKLKASVIFATQAVDHLAKTAIIEDVVNSCATNIFLANPNVDIATYAETFKMSPSTAELIRPMIPQKEFLYLTDSDPKRKKSSGKIAKVLRLEVSARERWLYSNSAPENVRRNAALKKFDNNLHLALDYLVANPTDN
jgi:type IV secretion system protein VirB4